MDAGLQFIVELRSVGNQGGQHVEVHHLVADGHNHFLLARRTVKVAALSVALAGIGQGHCAGEGLHARFQGNRIARAERIDRDLLADVHVQPAHRVDEALEGIEVDLRVVLDRHADKGLHSFHRQAGATTGQFLAVADEVGGVDLAVTGTRDVHPHVARDGQHASRLAERVHCQQDHRIGARRFARLPIAIIQTHQQNGNAAGAVPGLRGGAGVCFLQRYDKLGAFRRWLPAGGSIGRVHRSTRQVDRSRRFHYTTYQRIDHNTGDNSQYRENDK